MSSPAKSRTRSNSKSFNGKLTKPREAAPQRAFYNDRFHLKEAASLLSDTTIPQSNVSKISKLKLPHLSPPEKSLSQRTPSTLPMNPVNNEDSLPDLLKALENLLTQKSIPEDLQQVFKSNLSKLPRSKAANLINHEIKSLKQNNSSIQQMLKSIKSREESLKSIFELNNYLTTNNWVNLKEVHLQCAELLHGHRLFTLNAIESITKWRSSLISSLKVNNVPAGFIECKYEDNNYLVKMRNDLDFLKNSEFAKILNFEAENDPLLVAPSIPVGRNERGRKRDPNYFVDEGSVIVPIPSFMMARVKEAENIVRNEYEYIKFLNENTPEKQAQVFGPQVLEAIIEEEIEKEVDSIIKDFKAEQKEAKKMQDKEKATNSKIKKVNLEIIEEVLEDELNQIVNESLNEMKKNKKLVEDDKLAQMILASLIEELSQESSGIASSVHKDTKQELEFEEQQRQKREAEITDKVSREIFSSLFEDFLKASAKDLALETLKEYRRAREEESSLYVVKSALMEEIGLDFATLEYFSDLEEMRWVPLKLPEEQLNDVLNEYYSVSPDENHTILPTIDQLLVEVTKYADPCWYWAIKGTLILGFLVFSSDCFNKTGKKIIVHHVSSLYWNKFSDILASATQHMWKVAAPDEIRINLITGIDRDLTPDTKRIFTQLGYKWKTKFQLKESNSDVIVLGKSKGQKNPAPAKMAFALKCSEVISVAREKEQPQVKGNHYKRFGNRQNMLHALLGLFGKLENSSLKIPSKVQNKLQETINSLFNSMNETQSFSFPSITGTTSDNQLQEFLSLHNLNLEDSSLKSSASVLEVKFRWIGCTNFSLPIKNSQYRYMRFRSKDLKCMKLADEIEAYYIPTELPNLKAFFIKAADLSQSINRTLSQGLDLFCFVEKIASNSADEEINEFWVPCFSLESAERLDWVKGYEISPQIEGEAGEKEFVKSCDEKVSIAMNLNEIPDGLLIAENKYGPVIINDFVFGLFYSRGDKILDIPLFSCLVKQDDWIRAEG